MTKSMYMKIGIPVVLAALVVSFQNCAEAPVEQGSTGLASTGSLLQNATSLDQLISSPTIGSTDFVGTCTISLTNRGYALTMSGIGKSACASACTRNTDSGANVSCSFSGSTIANSPTKRRGICTIYVNRAIVAEGVASTSDCTLSCQARITSAGASKVACVYEDRLVFNGAEQTGGKDLGTCAVSITGAVTGTLSFTQVSLASCDSVCTSLTPRLGSQSTPTCNHVAVPTTFNVL